MIGKGLNEWIGLRTVWDRSVVLVHAISKLPSQAQSTCMVQHRCALAIELAEVWVDHSGCWSSPRGKGTSIHLLLGDLQPPKINFGLDCEAVLSIPSLGS